MNSSLDRFNGQSARFSDPTKEHEVGGVPLCTLSKKKRSLDYYKESHAFSVWVLAYLLCSNTFCSYVDFFLNQLSFLFSVCVKVRYVVGVWPHSGCVYLSILRGMKEIII